MDRVGIVFLVSLALGVVASFLQRQHPDEKVVDLRGITFTTGRVFNIGAVVITVMLIGLYAYWW